MTIHSVPYYFPFIKELWNLSQDLHVQLLDKFLEECPKKYKDTLHLFLHDYSIFFKEKEFTKVIAKECKLVKKITKKLRFNKVFLNKLTRLYLSAIIFYFNERLNKDKELYKLLHENNLLYYYYYHIFYTFLLEYKLLEEEKDIFYLPSNENEIICTRLYYFSPLIIFTNFFSKDIIFHFQQIVFSFEKIIEQNSSYETVSQVRESVEKLLK